MKEVTRREFVNNTAKYLKLGEEEDIVITHRGDPCLYLSRVRTKTVDNLKGLLTGMKTHGDINDHELTGIDDAKT